jgi:hypothetical protein
MSVREKFPVAATTYCERCSGEGRDLRGHPNDPHPRDVGPCPACEGDGRARPATAAEAPAHPIGVARNLAVAKLAALTIPRIVGEADGPDLRALTDFLEAVWGAVDPLIEAVGREAQANATVKIGRDLYQHQLRGALEGSLTFEINRAADVLDEEQRDGAALSMWEA